MLGRGLIAEAAPAERPVIDEPEGEQERLVITPAGLDAIGVASQGAGGSPAAAASEPRTDSEPQGGRPRGKLGAVLDAVSRPDGATLEDLSAFAGWQPHTTRAAISRLRQRGYDVRVATTGTRKAYHLVAAV